MSSPLRVAYDRLSAAYGLPSIPPAGSPLEAIVAAVIGLHADRRKVERVIAALGEAGLLDARRLSALAAEELLELLRPAGDPAVKVKRLRGVLRLLAERYDGDVEEMLASRPDSLREDLLAMSGIGPETADAILLHAAGAAKFVVGTYARRVAVRHGWVDFDADYQTIQETFESGLEPDAALYNAYDGLLTRVGKEHCKPTPVCEGCPLADLLPEDRDGVRRPLVPEHFD